MTGERGDRVAGLSREEKARLFEKLRARGAAPGGAPRAAPGAGQAAELAAGPLAPIPRLPPDYGSAPLSFSQGRLWWVDRLTPGDPNYHIPTPLRIRGRFSPAAMAAALGGVVARHEALRTTFLSRETGPVQRIEPPAPVPLPRIDLSACPEPTRRAELSRVFIAESARPFSLSRGPLLRALFVALGPEDQALLLNLHHIVSDGWSASILVAEATALYAAVVSGTQAALPALPIQYADFAVWQRAYLSGAELTRQLGYWRGALAGAPPELSLPHDFERRGAASGGGRSLPFELSEETSLALRDLARSEGATPFMVLLAAWGLFLGRLAQVDDLVIGTSIANRNRAETAGLIGLFANLLPLRLGLSADRSGASGGAEPTFRELVRRARKTALGAFAHQDLPFERLVEEINAPRRPGLTPIFQALFVFLNTPEPRLEAAGLAFEPVELPATLAKFDLGLGLVEQGGRFSATLDYATDLFAEETAVGWRHELAELIRWAVAAPDRAVGFGAAQIGFDRIERASIRTTEEPPPFVPPATPLERSVAEIWAKVLGVDLARIGRHSSFFDLGGHSLLAVELALSIERAYRFEISLRTLFESPDLASFTASLAAAGLGERRAEGPEGSEASGAAGRAIPRLAIRPDPLPLSFAQSRLWLLDRLEKSAAEPAESADPTYHIPTPLRVRGRFVKPALRAALSAVVARHEALRTTFAATEGGPVQRISPPGPVALPGLDLAAVPAEVREGEMARVLFAEAVRPFSLERGPLLRAVALRLGPEDHALLLNLHHIVSDGWSSSILIGEAVAFYAAALAGRPAAVPPLPIQYADFAVWQRAFLAGPELDRQLGYWRGALDTAPFELPLPLDRPRPPRGKVRSARGGGWGFGLATETAEALRAFALAENATPFMVLLAVWGLFLGRTARVSDLVVGTPIANRNRVEIGGLIGFFVNTLAIRLRLSNVEPVEPAERTFRDLVRQVRQSVLDAFAHQDLPFERLVEALDPPRDSGLSPIFQVLFAYQTAPSARLEAAGLVFEPIDIPSRIAKFDLSLVWAEVEGRIDGAFEYALDLFAPETMSRWAEELTGLVERALASPDEPAWDLAGLDALGRARLDFGRSKADAVRGLEPPPFEAPASPLERIAAELWADLLGVDLARIGRHSSFFDLGGHSLLAAQLATRVERAFGVEISLRALFDRPTLSAFAEDLEAAGARLGPPEVSVEGASAASSRPSAPSVPSARAIPRLAVRPDPLPLSFAQSRLWVLDRLASEEETGDPTYHIPAPLRVRGRFDASAMKAALEGVVARHEALRTTFESTDDGPVQRISAAGPVALPRIDLSACAAPVREGELMRVMLAEAARPFSLSRGPLLRAVVVRLAADDHGLLLNLHHIVSDGWSSAILVAESAALYAAAKAGRMAPIPQLPPLPVQYADFAVWQRAFLSGPELSRQLGFWREALSGAPPELPLPFDRPRPKQRTPRGGQAAFELPGQVAEALRSLAREERATPFMILLAAWGLFLGRYAGVSDLVVGTPIANRNRAEITGLIGFFVNTLAIRLRLGRIAGQDREPSFRDLVQRARQAALDAFAHQDLPFERLVEELQPDRNLGGSPIFQTLFSYLNTPEPKLEAAGLSLAQMELPFAPPKFDLSIGLADRQGRLGGSIEYALDLFDRETAERWSVALAAQIGRAMADPDRPARDLAALTEAERRQLFVDWNPAADPRGESLVGLPFPTLPELFRRQAAATPEKIAVRRGTDALTFRDLDARSDRLARRLVALGARPETLVGVCLPRAVDLIVALLAVLKSGAAYLPLDPAYPPERLAFMLKDAGSRLAVGEEEHLGRLAAGLAASDPQALASFSALTVVAPQAAEEEGAGSIALPAPSPASLAYAIYTSGSTGRPKGVAIEHAQAAAMLAWGQGAFGAEECAGMLASTSVCFDLSVFEIFLPLTTGGTVLLAENALELAKVASWGDTCPVRLVNTVPSAMAELVRQGAIPESVRTICLAGEALPAELLAAIFRTTAVERVWNLYGPSEDTTYSTAAEFRRNDDLSDREVERRAAPPIGRAIPGGRAYLLDPGDEGTAEMRFDPVPAGAVGELFLGGLGVARGYLGRPELTAERFVPDPFGAVPGARLYKTGDLARFRTNGPAAGELLFLGRRDHQLKVRGFRIELGEIESALRADARVADAVVVAHPESPEGGTVSRLAAYVVPALSAVLDAGALRQILAGRLPEAFQPSFWVLLPELPKSPNGKIDRRALPDPVLAGAPEEVLDPPASPLEKLAAKLWSEVLGLDVERIGRQSSFFTLGGHSLLGAQLATRTERLLQVNLPLRVLFEQPTLEGFAAQIAALDAQPGRAEKIARAVLRVQAMSGAQKDALRPGGEPVGA